MLVRCDSLIPTLLDALFLDPEHPRKDMEEALRAGIQRDGAECLLQLARVDDRQADPSGGTGGDGAPDEEWDDWDWWME